MPLSDEEKRSLKERFDRENPTTEPETNKAFLIRRWSEFKAEGPKGWIAAAFFLGLTAWLYYMLLTGQLGDVSGGATP